MRTPAWAERSAMAMLFWRNGKDPGCPVIDAHGHMGAWKGIYFPRPEPDQILRRMDRAGVRMLVFSHHGALSSPEAFNRPAVDAVRAHPDRLRAYCVYNPRYRELSETDLASFDGMRDVFVGIKLHGDMHGVPYTDPRYAPAWEFADARDLPVLVHSWGGSLRDGEEHIRAVAGKYPRARLIIGHSLHDRWGEAVQAAKDFPQTFLDLCAVLDERTGVLERFAGEVGSERILFGTDLPWFDLHYYIAGVLAADISEDDQRNILYRNAERLFGLER